MIPWLLIIPAAFVTLLCFGWTREDIIEDSVVNIWTRTGSDYYKDREYAQDLGVVKSTTTFLAMATSRDSNNIFSEERLEEIRVRMEAVENVTVKYNDNTYEWKDICAQNNIGLGTVYEFPCVRLSPMDFFQEANWFMNEADRLSWYEKGIKANLVVPRIGRFGIMSQYCSSAGPYPITVCDDIISLRQNATYAIEQGFDADYADPLALFSDLASMEMNHPCRACIEPNYETVMEQLFLGAQAGFYTILGELDRSIKILNNNTSPDMAKIAKMGGIIQKVGGIVAKLDQAAIEDFFAYQTTRGLYLELGAEVYSGTWMLFNVSGLFDTLTPDPEVLLQHADGPFSSHNTMGSFVPWYNQSDPVGTIGTGFKPYGGSGVDLSGTPTQMLQYFGLLPGTEKMYSSFADPDDGFWQSVVEGDPVYKWFTAGETPMTSHCGNEDLTAGVYTPSLTQKGCTDYSLPLEDELRTEQHFARMWYDLLIDSDAFLGLTQGESDPYTWTTGEGCGYELKGERASYTGKSEDEILKSTAKELYYIDEGSSIGTLDKSLLMGGSNATIQNIYPALHPRHIPNRVQNCNRPRGAINITEADAEVVLELFKKAMVKTWTEEWDDDNAGEVQFVGFFDDLGVGGTFSFLLADITDDNGKLTLISIALITFVSVLFLASPTIESKIMITIIGVLLVILSFFAALGFGILIGIKININIAWTLPFIIIGLGVDDMYIVLHALKEEKGCDKQAFVAAMKKVVVPVTMTSIVNASMFAVMNVVDIGAIYKTAQAAMISVIFLYLVIIFCFPAYCYLDMMRQQARRRDVIFCVKVKENGTDSKEKSFLFDKIYKPLVFGGDVLSLVFKAFVVLSVIGLLVLGIIGITQREVGLGLNEFFPDNHQASVWSGIRTKDLASWPIGISWGALNYNDPDVQMQMIKQYENIVQTDHISRAGTDTKFLWLAKFNLWTTGHCEENLVKFNPSVKECGRDQLFLDINANDHNTTCSGTWTGNKYGLADKKFSDPKSEVCLAFEGGICRPETELFEADKSESSTLSNYTSFCPVFEGWSDAKLKFCVEKWREHTGGGGRLLVEEGTAKSYEKCAGEYYSNDAIQFPIEFSASPSLFAHKLNIHDDTLDLIEETRSFCDDNESIHCWMTGIPFDYWEQYLTVETVLVQLICASIAVGFGVAGLFLFVQLKNSGESHSTSKIMLASLTGATLIAMTCILCVIPVVGISILAGVNLTAFSNMAFVLSIGFAVEYSVHVVHRFLTAPNRFENAEDRVMYTMEFLTMPLTLSFLSSVAGVACLAFTDFKFNEVFFFRPLMILMVVSYYIGTWFLPIALTVFDFDWLKVGSVTSVTSSFIDNH